MNKQQYSINHRLSRDVGKDIVSSFADEASSYEPLMCVHETSIRYSVLTKRGCIV